MITCTVCGQSFSLKEMERGHECIKPSFTSDDSGKYDDPNIDVVSPKMHSVIVEGKEYFVDANKLAILEKLIQL